MSLEMMEWRKKEDDIEGCIFDFQASEWHHIDRFKVKIWMESSRFFDHPERAIESKIGWESISIFFCFFEESSIATADIEDRFISLWSYICKDSVELWPGVIFPTLGKCMSKMIVGHGYIIWKSWLTQNKRYYNNQAPCFQEEQGVLLLNAFHFMKRFRFDLPYWKHRSVRIEFSLLQKRVVTRKR